MRGRTQAEKSKHEDSRQAFDWIFCVTCYVGSTLSHLEVRLQPEEIENGEVGHAIKWCFGCTVIIATDSSFSDSFFVPFVIDWNSKSQ
jgi:hypothetical protein